MNHDQDIRDVRNIDPNRSTLLIEYRMDFPMLKLLIIQSREENEKLKKNIPTPNVFELTEIALANLELAGVKYR